MGRPKPRADALLAERGLASDRRAATALILSGRVLVSDAQGRERRLATAGERVDPSVTFRIKGGSKPYASRAGRKLEAGLDRFSISVEGRIGLDLGLSTGGFTDCLLKRGARRVHGVDVAYGVVDFRLRKDSRVILYERTNARHLRPEDLGERIDVVVVDLSFIGLTAIWPVLPPLLAPKADVLALVKPQFELPREQVQGGVVRSAGARQKALRCAAESADRVGLSPLGALDSPVRGRLGNQESILYLRLR